jgi:hypothetical protein
MNKYRNSMIVTFIMMVIATVLVACQNKAAADDTLEITATAPVFVDECATLNDETIVPEDTDLIDYTLTRPEFYEGEPVIAQWVLVDAALTPLAVEQGYILAGPNHWEHVFDDFPCEHPDGEPEEEPQVGSATRATKKCLDDDTVIFTTFVWKNGWQIDQTEVRPAKATDKCSVVPQASPPVRRDSGHTRVQVPTAVDAGL